MRAALNVASAVEGNLRRWTFFTEASRLSHEYDDCAAGSYLAGLHRAMDGAMRGDGADYQRSALIPAVQSLLKARLLLGPLSSLSKSRRQIVNLRQDKLLQRFGELVCAAADELADDLRSNDTAEQAAGETLAAVAEAADHVLNELKGNVDWNAMQAMPVMQNATGGDVNLARLKAWVDAAKACGRDDYDPWAKSETAERRQSVVREITSSVARLRELGAEEKDDSLLREAEELNSRAKSEVERPSKIPPLLGRRAARDLAVSDALRDLSVVRFAASEEVLNRSKTLLADLTRLSGVTASGSQTLDEQWLRRRNAIVELVAQRQMDGVGAARALNALRTRLIELDSDKRLAPSVQASLNDRRPWNAAAVKLITADVRDDAIRTALPIVTPRRIANDALEGLPGRDEPKWNQAADRYAQLREEAASLVRDFNLMLDALEALMSPDDPLTAPAGKSSLRTLYAQWQERLKQPDELLRRPELAGAIAVANRASRLLAVSALDPDVPAQRDELQHVLLSGKSDPELTVAAWRRLPLLPAEDEARARAKVLGAIATVPSAERQAALKTMIAERALDRWLAAWLVATADAAKVNQEPQKVDALAARVAEFESDPRRLLRDRKLDERAKYDLLLAQLRNTARSGKLDESGDGRGALNELKRDVQTFCPSLEKEPALAALLARATQQASSSADLSKSGPGSVQWRRVPTEGDADGRRIAFAPPEGSPLRLNLKSLVFERVEPPTEAPMKDAARPFYLCTTAVPVDLFLSAVNDHLSEFTPLFPDVGSGDSRAGPRSWEWVGKQARLTRFWLAAVPTRQQDYPDTLRGTRGGRSLKDEVGGDPSYDHPIQYVTPEAAVYFAALLGSRLPTPEEWLAAHQMELQRAKANGAAVTWNLRDQTWEAQRKYAEQLVQNRLDPAWPDAGIFVPEKTKRSGRDAEAVQPGVDDQRLWFDKVNGDAGRTFHHLVGNVATFALADRENTDQLLRRGNVRPQDARDLLQQPGVLSVIGASALSPPEIDWNDPRPQPLNVRYAQNHGGYADVGIRLAFSAPTDTLATYVLQNARYLPTR